MIADEVTLSDETGTFSLAHIPGEKRPLLTGPLSLPACARFGLPGFDVLAIQDPPLGDLEILSPDEWEHRRIELGIPDWGKELAPGLLPAEAGLDEYMVSFDKGCYLGQEVVSRMKRAGKTNKHLVKLTVPEGTVAPAPFFHEGKEAGEITSVSPLGGIALGFRKRRAEDVGEFSAQEDGGGATIRVR